MKLNRLVKFSKSLREAFHWSEINSEANSHGMDCMYLCSATPEEESIQDPLALHNGSGIKLTVECLDSMNWMGTFDQYKY